VYAAGFTDGQLKRAKKALAIVSDKKGDHWEWQLRVCVPKTSSVLIRGGNRLTSAHHDCDVMFRAGRLGRAI
jgi:hypothetical protein